MKTSLWALLATILILTIALNLIAGSSSLAYAVTSTDDWPTFHHDISHSGYSTTPSPTSNQTLWTYTTDSYIEWSSPVVSNGLIYIGSDDGKIYCLNVSTGTKIWSFTIGSEIHNAPSVANNRVYIGANDNKVYCLNASTGVSLWNYTTNNWVESSPSIANGRVYVASDDNNVYCLNATTGARIWKYETANIVLSSPALVNGVAYIGSEDGKVYAIGIITIIPEYTTIVTTTLVLVLLTITLVSARRKLTNRTAVQHFSKGTA
jgi:outer membrane protein assembly factor BamB